MEDGEKETQAQKQGWWQRLVEFHRGRLLTNILHHDKEEYGRNAAYLFDSTKKLSDFIGMIIRFTFLNAVLYYFIRKIAEFDDWRSYILGFCFVSALGLTIALGVRIFLIILMWDSENVHKQNKKWQKWLVYIMAIVSTASLWYGIRVLVDDLAKVGLGT